MKKLLLFIVKSFLFLSSLFLVTSIFYYSFIPYLPFDNLKTQSLEGLILSKTLPYALILYFAYLFYKILYTSLLYFNLFRNLVINCCSDACLKLIYSAGVPPHDVSRDISNKTPNNIVPEKYRGTLESLVFFLR